MDFSNNNMDNISEKHNEVIDSKKNIFLKSGFQGEQMIVIPKPAIRRYDKHELIGGLYLTDIGYFPKAANHFRIRPKGCDEFILIYCVDGRGTITSEDKAFEVQPNTFFIIGKNKKHNYRANRNDPWSIYWIHFSGRQAHYLYDRFKTHNSGRAIFIPFNRNRVSEFEYILELLKLGYTDQVFEYSSMLLHKLLGSFIYYSLKSTNIPEISREDLVNRIKQYLNDNIYQSLTLNKIENEFNKSSSTLFTVFKERTGYSIMYFFSLIKVQKACELLNLTGLSIKEISYKLDFQDPLYFSRVFKKIMGVPPSEYKKGLYGRPL